MAYFISFLLTAMNFNSMDIIRFSLIRVTLLVPLFSVTFFHTTIQIYFCILYIRNPSLFILFSLTFLLLFSTSNLPLTFLSYLNLFLLLLPLPSTSLLLRLIHFLLFLLTFSYFSPFFSFFYESLSFQFIAIHLLSFQHFSFFFC